MKFGTVSKLKFCMNTVFITTEVWHVSQTKMSAVNGIHNSMLDDSFTLNNSSNTKTALEKIKKELRKNVTHMLNEK